MSDGTSFTYAAPDNAKANKAITDEAKSHVWEHKPIGGTIGDGVPERVAFGERAVRETFGNAQARRFTRDEVLLVLSALKADTGVVAGREALDKAVRVFEKME